MTTLYVAGLWRYPVKTLAGQPLDMAQLGRPAVRPRLSSTRPLS